jgi:hypothetical protein
VKLLGIDPGKSGGLVMWNTTTDELFDFNMPEDDDATLALFREMGVGHDTILFIENPPTWAGGQRFARKTVNGHSSATLQGNYKLCVGLALGMGATVKKFVPLKWQNIVECRNTEKLESSPWKRKLKARAEELWPGMNITLQTADAFLVLWAGWSQLPENS